MGLAHLGLALLLGLLAKRVKLPPMVGFLVTGFVLHALGYAITPELQTLADFGVTLLLFSIGLKLRVGTLLSPPVWVGASVHMVASVGIATVALLGLAATGLGPVADLDPATAALIGFALSFSSTVFAVKVLDERGESNSLHGNVSIGILVMQDIFAVLFIAIAAGQAPSPWALGLLLLFPLRPLLRKLIEAAGHGELMILSGFAFTIAAYSGFDALGVKGDLGALLVGALLAGSAKADELAKALLGFKDLLLVGFFLTIGLSGAPSGGAVVLALILLVLVPVKAALFLVLLTRLRLRVRTALFSTTTLANYSEFGLIVGAVGVEMGLFGQDWLVIVAIALSATFVAGGPARKLAGRLYARHPDWLMRLERPTRLVGDEPIDPGAATFIVLGMGRVGTDVYDRIEQSGGHAVVGVDADPGCVERHTAEGRCVLLGDASDVDFWERTVERNRVRVILMTLSSHEAMLRTAHVIADQARAGPGGQGRYLVAGVCEHEDEKLALEAAGVPLVYDLLGQAGLGFVMHVFEELEARERRLSEPLAGEEIVSE